MVPVAIRVSVREKCIARLAEGAGNVGESAEERMNETQAIEETIDVRVKELVENRSEQEAVRE